MKCFGPLQAHRNRKAVIFCQSPINIPGKQRTVGIQEDGFISQFKDIIQQIKQTIPEQRFTACHMKMTVSRVISFGTNLFNKIKRQT